MSSELKREAHALSLHKSIHKKGQGDGRNDRRRIDERGRGGRGDGAQKFYLNRLLKEQKIE